MVMNQLAARNYRYYRWLIASTVGLAILLISLSTHYYQEVSKTEQDQQVLASRIINKLNKILSPTEQQTAHTLLLVGQPCESVMLALRYYAAQNQALRAILLVQNGTIYCSSIFGTRNFVFSALFPTLTTGKVQLELHPSLVVAKGTPTLVLWTPLTKQNGSGVLNVFNIELLANFLLEPQEPYAQRIVLNIGERRLEYGQKAISYPSSQQAKENPQYIAHSVKYPFSISLYGQNTTDLALAALPHHIPLALMLSLLSAYVVYLSTANRMSMTYSIVHAMAHNEFRVYCQPIINSENGKCVGIETLLRWKNKRQGWIPPDVFIPLAEQHDLIIPLTRHLMTTVVENLSLFPQRPSFYISINVAAEHFNAVSIIDDIRHIWLPANPMSSLMLELTERTSLSEIQHEQIKALKEMGIMLAIDDFGTGHSSLSYLKKLSPDVLKIDHGFTAAIGTDAINATVTDTIITLAQRLKLKLVAEGVETKEQVEYLRSRKVDALQGYYFAKPMPIGMFPSWLQQYETRQRAMGPQAKEKT
ncbi:EAL domain-containing protein [Serratia sp. UGAL515B_01]|uniref:EAL domain-containing protein n=1 Tax=Serratia sp. UGAL515B_01 TaxID=2986763 RepID=UPI002955748D|nr:EAL domain-containing protein [Serratia sp. UGAL515B_01]WON78317.1 EAL domain-containing protein [Serratia sp. UGAL515B_01]